MMYCGNCGKQMPDQAEFCPSCGAANPNAVKSAAVSTSGRLLGSTAAAGKMSIFRIALIVLGVLHILAFVGLSYAELSGMGVLLSYALPENMTAMSYISFSMSAASEGWIDAGTLALNVVVCLLPVLLGASVILVNVRRKGYGRSLLLAVCLLLVYLFLGAVFGELDSNGYAVTSGGMLACLMAVLTIVASGAGLLMDSKK